MTECPSVRCCFTIPSSITLIRCLHHWGYLSVRVSTVNPFDQLLPADLAQQRFLFPLGVLVTLAFSLSPYVETSAALKGFYATQGHFCVRAHWLSQKMGV